ncbi:MAG: YbhB/YbcL family Raf kinase inhibitor-like protein [Myxococcota bacterium]|nr:YbhB/YbcL family Raf kinase inhibitor-like protein [Myxococcota bacterium]
MAAVLLLAGTLGACRTPKQPAAAPSALSVSTLTLDSPAFEAGAIIPRTHTCQGKDIAPELRWSGLPEGTQSLVLIMDDPDGPSPENPRFTFVHWVVYDLPATAGGLPEAVRSRDLPEGSRVAPNDFGLRRYNGPCPPQGRHRYIFKLYALDTTLGALPFAANDGVLAAMEGHVLDRTELIGRFQRGD